MRISLTASFRGGDAEHHLLPAYEAIETLYGISRSVLITVNYISEGRVRYKNFPYDNYRLNLLTNRDGSFETIFEVIYNLEAMTVLGVVAGGVLGNLTTDLLKTVFRRSIGGEGVASITQLEEEGRLRSGDVEALIDAVEPSMRKAHTSIGRGSDSIFVISGDNNVVNFNHASKSYVSTSVRDDEVFAKRFSIGSFNANDGTGRAFDFDLGRTVPFQIAKGADVESIRSISESISSYALKRAGLDLTSNLALRYTRLLSVDGRVKKIYILKARSNLDDLNN